jgi:hypothetical protein
MPDAVPATSDPPEGPELITRHDGRVARACPRRALACRRLRRRSRGKRDEGEGNSEARMQGLLLDEDRLSVR